MNSTRSLATAYVSRALLCVAVLAGGRSVLYGQSDQRLKRVDVGSVLLDPASIRITDHFEQPATPTTLELAIRAVGEQIDAKRDAAAAQAAEPFWNASFSRYLPKGGGSMNSPMLDATEDDPFFTPEYLKLSGRILDREVAEADKRARLLFGR